MSITICDVDISGIKINGVETTGTGKRGRFKNMGEMVETVLKTSKTGTVVGCGPWTVDAKLLCKYLNESGATFIYQEEKHKH